MRHPLKRRWFWGLLASPFILLAVAFVICVPRESASKFRRITSDMTRAQVVEVMGREPKETRQAQLTISSPEARLQGWKATRITTADGYWYVGGDVIVVGFDHDGRVSQACLISKPTIIDKVRYWLRRYIYK
jgi:hypothetical protein